MKKQTKLNAVFASSMLAFTFSASAAVVVPIADVFTHNEKGNFGGFPNDMINGSGMNGNPTTGGPMPSNVGDWVPTSTSFAAEWQSGDLLTAQTPSEDLDPSGGVVPDGVGPTNGKIGWAVFDLGSEFIGLKSIDIWHIREATGPDRVATDYNIYIASTPTGAIVHGPTGNNSRDYDFASGGWTLLHTGLSGSSQGQTTHSLGANTARYIGIEIMNNSGNADRVGFAEVGISLIPEPSSTALLGLGGLASILRRRR